MKNIFVILMLVFFSAQMAEAQRASGEKMKALKIAIFTEELDLTTKEAEQFWPLYNEYETKIREIHYKSRKQHKATIEGKSDKEIEKMIEERFKLQEQKVKLERSYYKKFKKVLPIKKVAKIPSAQRKFKLALMKKSKESRKGRKLKENR